MENENKQKPPESFEGLMKGCMESMGDMGDFSGNMPKTMGSCFSSFNKEGENMGDLCQTMFQDGSCCQPKSE